MITMKVVRNGVTEEIVVFADPPQKSAYHHVDVDGDRLGMNPAVLPDGRRGVNIITDPQGSTLLLADIPGFVEALQGIVGDLQ